MLLIKIRRPFVVIPSGKKSFSFVITNELVEELEQEIQAKNSIGVNRFFILKRWLMLKHFVGSGGDFIFGTLPVSSDTLR